MKLIFRDGPAFAADLEALHECATAYFWHYIDLLETVEMAIDIGAHVGYWTVILTRRFPYARVIAVEPMSANSEIFRHNALHLRDVTLYEAYCEYEDKDKLVYTPDRPGGARVVANGKYPGTIRQPLPDRVTLEKLMEHVDKVDVLKIDCEGSEQSILMNCKDETLDRIGIIVGEYHSSRVYFVDTVGGRLREHGFYIEINKRDGQNGFVFFGGR